METNYVSDAVDVPQEALMDEPFCTVRLDLSQLPVSQQAQVIDQLGPDKLADDEQRAAYGAVAAGADDEPWTDLEAVLHVDVGRAMTFLQQVGIFQAETPEEDLREVNDDGE